MSDGARGWTGVGWYARALASSSMPVDWTQPMVNRDGGFGRERGAKEKEKEWRGAWAALAWAGGGGRGRGGRERRGTRRQTAADPPLSVQQAPALFPDWRPAFPFRSFIPIKHDNTSACAPRGPTARRHAPEQVHIRTLVLPVAIGQQRMDGWAVVYGTAM